MTTHPTTRRAILAPLQVKIDRLRYDRLVTGMANIIYHDGDAEISASRPVFQRLKAEADQICRKYGQNSPPEINT